MLDTLEAINVTNLRAGDRVMLKDYSDEYLVVRNITVRTAHTVVAFMDVSDPYRIREHYVEYGNSVYLEAHSGTVLDILHRKRIN